VKSAGFFKAISYRLSLLVILSTFFGTAEARTFSYPALDTTSHWTIQDWGFTTAQGFYIQGAEKKIWTGPGQPQSKTAFYNLAVVGVRLGGAAFAFQGQDFMGEMMGDGYIAKYGSFKVTPVVSLTVVAFFMDDGKFELNTYFGGPGYVGTQAWDVVVRMDYDMAGAGNNIAEFLWNKSSEGGTVSPPQSPRSEVSDGRLVYAYSKSAGSGYWAAISHEISVAYPPLARESGFGIENAGFARILNASNPQFGMVLWNDAVTPLEAVFKAYGGFDGNLWPKASIASPLQNTGETGALPRYAFAGRDQMVFLVLNAPSGGGTYRVGGKLFQRANTRPLAVVVRQHPPEYMDGFSFDADRVLRVNNEGARTFRNALGALAGENDFSVFRSGSDGVRYLPFDGYASPGQAITEAQLHNLLVNSREVTSAALENVRDWRLDLLIVDWVLQGEPGVWEAMFDYGNADANGISREGGVVFWPSMRGRNLDFQMRQATMSSLHAAGLALNMDPSWGACSFAGYCWVDGSGCGGLRCGSGCPAGAQGCRYSAYNCLHECREGTIMSLSDVDRNTVGFNRAAAAGSPFSEFDWYRKAPEAWVKPGRFGAPPISGPMPPFTPN
jgi:hypothetical protein